MISCPKAALSCQKDLNLSKKYPATSQPVEKEKKDNSHLDKAIKNSALTKAKSANFRI